ncbi:hypothetical protein [Hydrocarboniphaga sp.]|uniref:hypothetical protein n=1 Tax=Hydrocarboniphaga sp. TaxID=2033016 RepID=UPI0026123441|nr:hypothetical protein [Hydrocarboniphaga sp.]
MTRSYRGGNGVSGSLLGPWYFLSSTTHPAIATICAILATPASSNIDGGSMRLRYSDPVTGDLRFKKRYVYGALGFAAGLALGLSFAALF